MEKNTLILPTLVATKSVDSAVKKVPKKPLYTFFQNVLLLLIPEGVFLTTLIQHNKWVESLCQVIELIFVDTVCDLIDSDHKSNVNSTD